MKAMFLIVILIGSFIYYDYRDGINNKDRWKQLTLYSIRIENREWSRLDIRLPPEADEHVTVTEYNAPIPHRYQLKREAYVIDIEVNPTEHIGPVSLQIVTTGQLNDRPLRVESSWGGNCGITGNITKTGTWGSEPDNIQSMGYPYFTNPKSIGFLWYRGTKYCKGVVSETIEHASSFPIVMKIYHDLDLIGEELIDFKIFENGIMKYTLTL